MAAFAEARYGVAFPTYYREAAAGLRLRVVDQTENEVPEGVESVEVGDDLRAVATWGPAVVSVDVLGLWGVSIDEAVATATRNVRSLPFERKPLDDPAHVVVTVGHPWVSSLISGIDDEAKGAEGAIVAIPRADVMMTAPVTGAETVDSLEVMLLLCDEIYDPDDAGVSPHVWWSWEDGLYRITDRLTNG
jgi:hypothetical protein